MREEKRKVVIELVEGTEVRETDWKRGWVDW